MKGIIALTLLLLPGIAAAALDNEKQLYEIASAAMAEVDKKNFSAAVEVLRPHMPLPKHEIDGLIYQINQQAPTIQERFGAPTGSELVCDQQIGTALKRITYLQKYENHAILWFFDFYRPKDKWIVNTFSFHDRWQELFKANCSEIKAS